MNCKGSETSLMSCASTVPDRDFHGEDAGVRCQPGKCVIRSEVTVYTILLKEEHLAIIFMFIASIIPTHLY